MYRSSNSLDNNEKTVSPEHQPVARNCPENNKLQFIDYKSRRIAAFTVDGKQLMCLPQAFEIFLKNSVSGLHVIYTKLKRLDITPVVCNVEQVRLLRGVSAIQCGVNRCKLIAPFEFDILYKDCTNNTSRPGRPPKRNAIEGFEEALEQRRAKRNRSFHEKFVAPYTNPYQEYVIDPSSLIIPCERSLNYSKSYCCAGTLPYSPSVLHSKQLKDYDQECEFYRRSGGQEISAKSTSSSRTSFSIDFLVGNQNKERSNSNMSLTLDSKPTVSRQAQTCLDMDNDTMKNIVVALDVLRENAEERKKTDEVLLDKIDKLCKEFRDKKKQEHQMMVKLERLLQRRWHH